MQEKAKQRRRNYPGYSLQLSLEVAEAIQNEASGRPIGRLTLAKLIKRSPGSSTFRDLLFASRAYGLTSGGIHAEEFELTLLGHAATGDDQAARATALKDAVMNIAPYATFLETYNGKKVPSPVALKEFLVKLANVPADWADDCMARLLDDIRFVGLVDVHRTGEWIDVSKVGNAPVLVRGRESSNGHDPDAESDLEENDYEEVASPRTVGRDRDPAVVVSDAPSKPKNVFVAHGKDKGPVEEVKKILTKFGVPFKVAEDEAHGGRPISKKVRDLLRDECSSAILIFSADERFLQEGPNGTVEVWRPSENVIHELGAASFLYENRIVILKDKRVNFPSNFSDLGHITFEEGQIQDKAVDIYLELKKLDIIEVTVKG